jgi:HK97 family phage major capsid protein
VRTNIQHLFELAYESQWAILPEKLFAIREFFHRRAAQTQLSADEIKAIVGAGPRERTASPSGNVAVLQLYGVISHRANVPRDISEPGGTSTEAFGQAFDAAMKNPDVSAIVIDVDSPGGTVNGVEELASKILKARGQGKQIIASVNSLCTSAAYWIASAADEIAVTPSGDVGSIGVYTMHQDMSAYLEEMGVKTTLIKAGPFKAEGLPHFPLTEDAKAALQTRVDETYDTMTRAIAKGRNVPVSQVRSSFGQGRVVSAKTAVDSGMADRVATLEQVLAKLGVAMPARGARAETPALDMAAQTDAALGLRGKTSIVITGGGSPEEIAALKQMLADEPRRIEFVPTITTSGTAPADAVRAIASAEPTRPQVAKEYTVDPKDTAAQPNGADTKAATDAILATERKRVDDITTLCGEHGVQLNLVKAFIASGKSADAVGREILTLKQAERAADPTIVVGANRESARPWESSSAFYEAVFAGSPGGRASGNPDPRLFAAASGMNQAVPSEGGFLVPAQFATQIWNEMSQATDALLPMTDNYTVTGESLTFPANAETSRATGSRYGGVKGYWIAEAEQLTKSAPKFRPVRLEPQQLAVLVYLTEKLINNAPAALGQYVSRAAADEINFLTGDAIVNGTGVGQPKGILASGAKITITKETNQANGTIQQENVSKMWARLHPRARAGAIWLHNVDIEPQLDTLSTVVKNVAGTENVGGYANKVFDSERRTLKGRPLVACEYCASLGAPGDLILWNPGWYATGTRGQGIQSAMSMHVRFEFLEQGFRFVFEVDGQTWHDSALTPYKGSNTLSSVLVISQR